MKRAAMFGGASQINNVYSQGRKEQVAALTELYPVVVDKNNFEEHAPHLRECQVIFSTWGMPALTAEQLDQLPSLRAVFYAAGSVQGFARPLLERGITVVSAWQANAVPVAEFTLAQILLATKGYFRNVREYTSLQARGSAFVGRGNFGETVAVLGAGAIGRKVIELLHPFEFQIVVFDPFLSAENAARLGVDKVTLEEAFERGYVVTNHLANLPETKKMLHDSLFERMRDDATFINTGRGATVDENALIRVLQERPSLTALLDVTEPEPPISNSPLWSLPNAHLTSHIAGSVGDEVIRMADYCIQEFIAWEKGELLRYAVSLEMLNIMA
jgi:phosphoglycerate dehydrogenase-like enzyme